MFQKIILESVQSHKDLNNFASYIIEHEAKLITNQLESRLKMTEKKESYSLFYFLIDFTVTYDTLPSKNKYSVEFLETLKKSGTLSLSFNATNNEKTQAQYDIANKVIYLYYYASPSTLTNLIENNETWLWSNFISSKKSPLIHELQHWYDSIRSFGLGSKRNPDGTIMRHKEKGVPKRTPQSNFAHTRNALAYNKKYGSNAYTSDASPKEYLNQYHEIIARFAQIMNNMIFTRIDSASEAVDLLKNNIGGWEYIPTKIQKKLIGRTVDFYNNLYKNKQKLPQIKNFVQRYVEKRKSQGYDIEINVAPSVLSVDKLADEKQLPIIKDLIKIANSFNQNLAIDKPILNVPEETMMQLGFKQNSQDDDDNVDVRFTYDEYFKYPNKI
jgi:hypothetical protein